jgi:putative transposase
MTKAVLERALQAEMTDHLGYDFADPAGHRSGNSRNGRSSKTVSTASGPVTLDVPRDRNGTFTPQIVPKRSRRLGNIDDMILSLYSRGMTTRDIEAHLREVYGVSASRELISNVTDVVVDEIKLWQSRPLDEVYPIVYVDGLRLRIKENGVVTMKVAYLVIGVDVAGRKHALGCWIQDSEGAKFWQKVLCDLRNRGVRDILICCCDASHRPARRHPRGVHGHGRADVRRARAQKCPGVRVLPGPQEGMQGDAGHVHRRDPRGRRARLRRLSDPVHRQVPRGGRRVA